MGRRALEKEHFELLQLGVGEVGRPMRMGLGDQGVGAFGGVMTPAIDRGAINAEAASHGGRPFVLIDELDMRATVFEFFRSSDGSAHKNLEG